MLLGEYLPFAGYVTSLIALVFAIFMFRNNMDLKNKYSHVMDAEKEAKRILSDAEEEKKSISNEIARMKVDYVDKKNIYSSLLARIDEMEEKIESDDAGFRDIQFEFDDPEYYRAAIEAVRNEQKFLVRSKLAATCSQEWSVNGSLREGSRMFNEHIKITMRAFNSECDVIIGNVNWKNIKQSQQNMRKVFDFYNNYNKTRVMTSTEEILCTI